MQYCGRLLIKIEQEKKFLSIHGLSLIEFAFLNSPLINFHAEILLLLADIKSISYSFIKRVQYVVNFLKTDFDAV